MSQFLMDFKRERILDSKLFHPSAQSAFTRTDTYNNGGVLDLSRPAHHRDSIETRKTPSPSNTSSFSSNEGSPGALSHKERSPINNNNNCINISQYSPKSLHSLSNHYEQSYSPATSEIDPGQPIKILSAQFSPNFPKHHQHSLALQNNFRSTPSPNLMGNPNVCKNLHIDPTETNITSTNLNVSTSLTSPSSNNGYPMIVGRDGKLARPFKAYPHDPLSIAASFTATDTLLDSQSAEKYTTFRKRMLEQIHAANGGYPTVSNPKMRRTPSKTCASGDSNNSSSEILSKVHFNNNNNNNNNDITTTNNNIKKFSLMNNNNNINTHCNSNDDSDSNNNSTGSLHGGIKDQAYYERRKKNNAAAKKSRDRRRIKEDEIAIRAAFLERENIELKFELAAARKQLQLYGVQTMA